MTVPARDTHPYLEAPPLAFAHRGGAAHGDENTVQAFARAAAAGYRYLEIDVHATADRVAVVLHDDTLDRVAGLHAAVGELTWADLRSVRVGGQAAVPRLDELLAAWPGLKFNIDVKADGAAEPAVTTVARLNAYPRVLLASFSGRRLRRLRALSRGLAATGLAQGEVARLWLASRAGLCFRPPASAVAAQVPVRHGRLTVVDRRFVTCAHRAGLHVHVWTVDDPAEMARLLDLGIDGIMTDHIDVLKRVFTERGLWKDDS